MILACDQFEDSVRILFGDNPDALVTNYEDPVEATQKIHELAQEADCVLVTNESLFLPQLKIPAEKLLNLPRLEAVYWNLRKHASVPDCLILSLGIQASVGAHISDGRLHDPPKSRNSDLTLTGICRSYIEKNSDLTIAVDSYIRDNQPNGDKNVLRAFTKALTGQIDEDLPLFWPPIILDKAVTSLERFLAELGTANHLFLIDWAAFGNLPALLKKDGLSVLGSPEGAFDHAVRGLLRWKQNQDTKKKPTKDDGKKVELYVHPSNIEFAGIVLNSGVIDTNIRYENLGNESLEGSISTDAPEFLGVSPETFQGETGEIAVKIDTSKLESGRIYSQYILIGYNGADTPLRIPVEIRVNARKVVELRCDRSPLTFVEIDVDSGTIEKNISYQKFGEGSLAGSISCRAPDFLKVTPSSLSPTKGDLHVTLDTSKLKWEQVYSTDIRIDYNGSDSPLKIPIQIKVNPPKAVEKAELRCDPPGVNFAGIGINSGIVREKVEYWKVGEPTLAGSIKSEAASFLTVTPSSLSADSGSINVALDTGQLKWGQDYSGHIRIDYNGADTPKWIPIRVKVKQKRNWVSYLFLGVLLPLALYVIVKTPPDSRPPPLPPPLLPPPAVDRVIAARDITDLNVRAGPTTSDKLLATVKLRQGETLKLLGSSQDRYRVLLRLNGKELDGWVIKEPFLTQKELLARASPTSKDQPSAGERKDGSSAPEPIPRVFSHSVPSHLWTTGLALTGNMMRFASIDGGVNHEADIADAKRRIEALNIGTSLPVKDRNVARSANLRGIDQQRRGNILEALQAYQEAYQANSGDVEIVNNLGYAHLLRGDESSSEQALSLALLLVPDRVSAWFNLGQLKAKQKNEAMAVACFANAYRFTPDKKRAYNFLKNSSNSDSDAAVRAALVKTLGLKLVRDIEEKPPSPPRGGGAQEPQQVGSGWIAHKIRVRLQDAGFGNIKVQQTGPQEIILSGQASSEDEAQKIREIAGREARGQAVVVRWSFDIAK